MWSGKKYITLKMFMTLHVHVSFNFQTDWFSAKKSSCLTSDLDQSVNIYYIKALVKSDLYIDNIFHIIFTAVHFNHSLESSQ